MLCGNHIRRRLYRELIYVVDCTKFFHNLPLRVIWKQNKEAVLSGNHDTQKLGHVSTMSFKITPSSTRILDPFAVFFITLGITNIALQIYRAIFPLALSARHVVFGVALVVAAIAAVVYSLVVLRNRLTMSRADRGLYFFIPLIFLAVGGSAFFIFR